MLGRFPYCTPRQSFFYESALYCHYAMNNLIRKLFLSRYFSESALTYRRVSALTYINLMFLFMGVVFAIITAFIQGMTSNVIAIVVLVVLLTGNLWLIRRGHFSFSVRFSLLLSFVVLSATVYLAYNRSHVSLYNLGFYHVFALLLAGLISISQRDSLMLGGLSIVLLAHYFFFEIIPAESLPVSAYIHDYLAITMVVILATFLSAYINRQINQLFDELETMNASLEQTVSERSAALVESEKLAALGSMVGGISHEINTPIGNTITGVSLLRNEIRGLKKAMEDGQLTRSAMGSFIDLSAEAVDSAERNLEVARNLVANFKKIAADLYYDSPVKQNIREEIDIILGTMQNSLKKRPELKFDIRGDEELNLPLYPGVLWHILTNLINNSLIHGIPVGAGTISIGFSLEGSRLILHYSDEGTGMDAETLKHHYEPFFTTRRGQGGTGLGMNIVYNILLKIGATISAESRPGEGVKYRISFPPTEAGFHG
jgi:signal transduction histidine kinase